MGCFAGLKSFQIFLSLPDLCWNKTEILSCLRRSRGQFGLAVINSEPATSPSRQPRSYLQLSRCFTSLQRRNQQLRCSCFLLNDLGLSGSPLLHCSSKLILKVRSSNKQRKLGWEQLYVILKERCLLLWWKRSGFHHHQTKLKHLQLFKLSPLLWTSIYPLLLSRETQRWLFQH